MPGLAETLAALAKRSEAFGSPAFSGGAQLADVVDFGANPGALRMRIHTPADLAPNAPLVVALHGCSQSADAYAEGSGWTSLADDYGFALLCPQQVRANNANLCFNWFEPGDIRRGGGEAASINAMITHTVARHGLDAKRVFVTGLSAGGAMANVMLATYPEIFAAGAIIAGLPYGSAQNVQQAMGAMRGGQPQPDGAWGAKVRAASKSAGPWPKVSIWHGDDDAIVQPVAALNLARQWTEVHGVASTGQEVVSAPGRRHTAWRNAQGEAVVELHRIAGMGHGVPLGCELEEGYGAPGPFMLEVGVSSALESLQAWGIAGRTSQKTCAPKPAAATPPPLSNGFGLAQHLTEEVGRTVTDALRRSGLLG